MAEPKRSFVNVKLNEQGFDVKKIASGGLIGLLLGTMYVGMTQIAKVSFKPKILLEDPPVPNMEELDYELSDIFRSFVGPFFKICPDENKGEYKNLIRQAITSAEFIFTLEKQIIKREIAPSRKHRADGRIHAERVMRKLRESRKCFTREVPQEYSDLIEAVSVKMQEQTTNLHNMTEDMIDK